MRKGIGAMKADYEALQNENEGVHIESGKMKGNLKALAMKFKQVQEELKKAAESNSVLTQENRGQASYMEELKINLDKMSVENGKLEKLYEEQVRNDKELWEQNKELKTHLNRARAMVDELNGEIQGMRSQLEVLEPDNERLKRVLEEVKRENEQLEQENRGVRHEWDMVKREFDSNWQGITRENTMLRSEVARLNTENEELNVSVVQCSRHISKNSPPI